MDISSLSVQQIQQPKEVIQSVPIEEQEQEKVVFGSELLKRNDSACSDNSTKSYSVVSSTPSDSQECDSQSLDFSSVMPDESFASQQKIDTGDRDIFSIYRDQLNANNASRIFEAQLGAYPDGLESLLKTQATYSKISNFSSNYFSAESSPNYFDAQNTDVYSMKVDALSHTNQFGSLSI